MKHLYSERRSGMLVRYWMATSPKTATERMNLEEVLEIMHKNRIRRLPVVKTDNDVCGIIALSDLYPYIGPNAIGRPLPESDAARLRNVRVADVMTKALVTCDHNETIDAIGALMRRQKIGAVPVVSGKQLVGIITESDILGALANIAQLGADGRRVCLRIPLEEKSRIFYRIVSLCENYGLEILTILTHPLEPTDSHFVMLRVRGKRIQEFIDGLWKTHYEVLAAPTEKDSAFSDSQHRMEL